METRTIRQILSLLVFCLGVASCSSPQKLVDQGNYDEAIALSIAKISGKKKKSPKHVDIIETAYRKATARDMNKVKALKAGDNPAKWIRIHDIYGLIQDRQEKISPFIPLVDKNGFQADFRFVKIDYLMNESRGEAATYLYASANDLLELAEQGDKSAAKKAYGQLEDIALYYDSYKDRSALMSTAKSLGMARIFFSMENNAPTILPASFEKDLMKLSVGEINQNWRTFYTEQDPNINFDYNIIMKIDGIDISPERQIESMYTDQKEIRDGWNYVLDSSGNVSKDSLGNDIKEERWVTIYADVIEVFQNKNAYIKGHLEFYDNATNKLVKKTPITVESKFENYASTFIGDTRALSNFSQRRINNAPMPFPTDAYMLKEVVANLKPIIKQKITYERLAGL